jgi:flagellar basal-body rod protein FlgC
MSFWTSLRIGASALSAQRLRLDIISNNVANAETTRTDEGGPYKRQDVVFRTKNKLPFLANLSMVQRRVGSDESSLDGVATTEIVTDNTAGPKMYDPTNPDADKDGYVTYPNVNLVVEMTNMISATRSYEASLAVIDAARTMAQRALEIGR